MRSSEAEKVIRPLLDHLAQNNQFEGKWQNWQIIPIVGGANNLIYRATSSEGDFGIKFTIRDERNRAGREYHALVALRDANLLIAPEPVLFDQVRYTQPVMVQTWLEGESSSTPPASDTEWEMLLGHFAAIHSLTPEKTSVRLSAAFLSANSIEEGRKQIRDQLARIPQNLQPQALHELVQRLDAYPFSAWSHTQVTLLRGDPNTLNFIRGTDSWWSVDWEASGWGDPAFEIADMMSHPQYMDIPASKWEWVVNTYAKPLNDATILTRIDAYYKILAVWWVARLARYLYEVPRGFDNRLVSRPEGWQADMERKYKHYQQIAETILSKKL